MLKKSISLITLIIFMISLLTGIAPVYANDNEVEITIKNTSWGVVDGNKIKWIPQQLSVQRFLENINVKTGSAVKEVLASDGVSVITDGFVRTGQKLRVTSGGKTSVYNLELALYIDYKMLSSAEEGRMTFPEQGQTTPDFPHTGIMVLEGTFTMTSWESKNITISYYNPTDYAVAIQFNEDGTITQFWGDNLGDRVRYELNKPTHFVVLMDLNNLRALTYVNGIAVSNDKVNGDRVDHLDNKRTFDVIAIPREFRQSFLFYTIPTLEDFSIEEYKCNLVSNNDKIIIDNDNRIIKINDENVLNKRQLFNCFVFENEAESKRVILEDVADGEIIDNAIQLRERHLVSVKSANGKVTAQYKIQSVNIDALYKLSDEDAKKANILKAIGVFDESEAVVEQAIVSRGDFARYLAKLTDSVSLGNSEEEKFSDVKKGNRNIQYINSVAAQGYMSGKGDGTFGANSKITYNEALAALIRAAGYDNLAQARGGWPGGYLNVATNLKLSKSVVPNENGQITRLDAARLLYNTLMTPYNDVSAVTQETVVYSADDTLLSHFHSMYEGKGRVTATKYTGIHSEASKTDEGFICIDDELYTIPIDAGYESFLGMKTEFFYKKNGGTPYEIIYLGKVKTVESVTIEAENISSVSGNTFYYMNEEDKMESRTLADGFSFIYNGKLSSGRTREDLIISDGEITLTDSQGTGKIDLVVAREAKFYEYEGMNEARNMIFATDENGDFVDIELGEKLYSIFSINAFGEKTKIGLSELKEDSVLTVYRSLDGECVEVEESRNIKVGKITHKSDDSIGINSEKYETVSTITKAQIDALSFDVTYNFKLNSAGRVAFIDLEQEASRYGYLIGADPVRGIGNSEGKLRMIIGAGEYMDYALAEKVNVNGEKLSIKEVLTHPLIIKNGDLEPTLVKFKLEGEKIKKLEIFESSDGEEISGALYMNTAGLILLDGRIVLDSSTFLLSVPIASEREDYLCYREPEFENERGQTVTIFDYNPDDRSCGAVLTYATTSQAEQENFSMQSKKGIISKVKTTLSEEGDWLQQIDVMTDGKMQSLIISNEVLEDNLDLRFGDVIRYAMNVDGTMIHNLVREFRVNPDGSSPEKTPHSTHDYYIFRMGRVIDKGSNYIVIYDEDEMKDVILPLKGNAEYIVDFESETITTAKVKDFIPNIHYLYAHSPGLYAPNIMVGYMFNG